MNNPLYKQLFQTLKVEDVTYKSITTSADKERLIMTVEWELPKLLVRLFFTYAYKTVGGEETFYVAGGNLTPNNDPKMLVKLYDFQKDTLPKKLMGDLFALFNSINTLKTKEQMVDDAINEWLASPA